MKYLKNLIFACIVLQTTFIFSQFYGANDFFNSSLTNEISDLNNYSTTTIYDFENATPKVYNVFFYGIERTTVPYEGQGKLTEEKALERIAQLNIAFNPYKIFFKYRGFKLHSEIYEGIELMNRNHTVMFNRMSEVIAEDGNDDKINIIFHHDTCDNDKGSADIYKKILSFRYCTSNNLVVNYQMGHLFGLFKTQRGTSGDLNNTIPQETPCNETPLLPDELVPPNFGGNPGGTKENVTRNITNPYYNANVAGDFVTDTPACFRGSELNYCHLFTGSTYEYIEHPSIIDSSPDQLPYINVDILNFMSSSYYGKPVELCHFTNGQGVRMRETIAIASLNFTEVETTIASLYEPYTGNYFYAGSSSSNFRPLFQPGFDYKYVYCGGQTTSGYESYNIPTVYNNISFYYKSSNILNQVNKFSLDLNNINHPNYSAIIIEQLENQPHKCYHNINRNASNGTVIKFLDGVPNTNVNVQPKNQTQINDTNLIQNLENGLYTIQKNFDDGSQEQRTILKNNN